jgi:hypothetical protein
MEDLREKKEDGRKKTEERPETTVALAFFRLLSSVFRLPPAVG